MSGTKWYLTFAIIVLHLYTEGSTIPGLVCPFGQFMVSCRAPFNATAIGWNITFPGEINISLSRLGITSTSPQSLQPIVIQDLTGILISRTSLSPLTSLLEINNTIIDLNGTRIQCTTTNGTRSTVLTITENGTPVPPANVSVIDQHYSTETVTITLEWSQGEDILYDFTVLISPQAEVHTNTTSTRAELQLSYNTHYNVSVVTHCGQNSTTTLQLHYATCSVPVDLLPTATITNYSRPPSPPEKLLPETTATVNCIGSNKTVVITCMDNGSWEPNPSEADVCLESTTGAVSTDTTRVTSTVETYTTAPSTSPVSTTVIIGISLGVLVALIIIVALIAMVLVIARFKYKGVPRRKRARFNFEDRHQTESTHPTGEQNTSVGQYSLLQAFPARERARDINNTVENTSMGEYSALNRDIPSHAVTMNDNTTVQNTTSGEYSSLNIPPRSESRNSTSVQNQKSSLVYADVGPLSFKQRRGKADLRVFDDDRVQYTQVDLTRTQKPPKRTKQPEPAANVDRCAPIDNMLNLDNLLLQIKAVVTPKWREFGKAIGVDDEVLNKCLEYAQEESIIEVCDKWLRNHTGKPTWREVAEALRQIGNQELAFEIENSYNTGKLPKSLEEEPVLPELVQDEEAPPIPPRMAL